MIPLAEPVQETKYRQVFLTTYKSFATAEEVFDLLLEQYDISHPVALNLKELEQWKEKKLKPRPRRGEIVRGGINFGEKRKKKKEKRRRNRKGSIYGLDGYTTKKRVYTKLCVCPAPPIQ